MTIEIKPDDKQRIKEVMASCLQTMKDADNLKTDLKEALNELKEKYGIKPKVARKALKAMLNNDLEQIKVEIDDVEILIDVAEKITKN